MARLPKRLAPNGESRARVGLARDLDILETVAWAGLLTTAQVERLFFRTRRRAQRRLRALVDHRLLAPHLQGEAMHRDNVYTLTLKGRELLSEQDAFAGAALPKPMRVPKIQKLAHALAIRDVFVSFLSAERSGVLEIEDLRFDSDLARETRFRDAGLIPDALAAVRTGGTREMVGIEVDLGTETTSTLRRKLAAWQRLLAEPMAGGASMRLLVVVRTDGRVRTVERLANALGLGAPLSVRLFAGLDTWIRETWAHEAAARDDRTERLPVRLQVAGNAPDPEVRVPAFRPLGSIGDRTVRG